MRLSEERKAQILKEFRNEVNENTNRLYSRSQILKKGQRQPPTVPYVSYEYINHNRYQEEEEESEAPVLFNPFMIRFVVSALLFVGFVILHNTDIKLMNMEPGAIENAIENMIKQDGLMHLFDFIYNFKIT